MDNLQPDFLYDHIQPVRAELMQALWTSLRNAPDHVSVVAFRVLGKFGGSNRKMLREPQVVRIVVSVIKITNISPVVGNTILVNSFDMK